MNITTLVGKLTCDINIVESKNRRKFCYFAIAVDRPYKIGDHKITDFVRCVAWEGSARLMKQYVKKGQYVGISGSIHSKKEGKKNMNFVHVERITFITQKKDNYIPPYQQQPEVLDYSQELPF